MADDRHSSGKGRRASIYAISGTAVLNAIKSKIKAADSAFLEGDSLGCFFQPEELFIKNKVRRFRRVYMPSHGYKVGWVVDADITFCMLCLHSFGWFGLKHHCRSCGLLVCSTCSPHVATIPYLLEEYGSRICTTCKTKPPTVDGEKDSLRVVTSKLHDDDGKPTGSVGNRMINSNTELSLESMTEGDENEGQEMNHKYETAYNTMRQIIPLDMCKVSFDTLLTAYHVPEEIAMRLRERKILWLIVMHPDDIAKIHLYDFHNTYVIAEDLDIVEMRAIWFNLPGWEELPDEESANRGELTPNSVYDMQVKKNEWRNGFKARLDVMNQIESRNGLTVSQLRNEAYLPYPDLCLFDPDAPLSSGFDLSNIYHQQSSALREHDNSKYADLLQQGGGGGGAVWDDIENAEDDDEEEVVEVESVEVENNGVYTQSQQSQHSNKHIITSPNTKNNKSHKSLHNSQSPLTALINDTNFESHCKEFTGDEEDEINTDKNSEINSSFETLERLSLDLEIEEMKRKKNLNKNTSRVLTQFYKEESSKSFRVQNNNNNNNNNNTNNESDSECITTSDDITHEQQTYNNNTNSHSHINNHTNNHNNHNTNSVHILPTIVSNDGLSELTSPPVNVELSTPQKTQDNTATQSQNEQTPPPQTAALQSQQAAPVTPCLVPVSRRRTSSGGSSKGQK